MPTFKDDPRKRLYAPMEVTFENGTRAMMPDRELNLSGGRLPGAGYALDCTRGFPHSLVILTREGRILGWIDVAKIGFPDVGHWLKAGAPGRQGEMASHSASPLRGRAAKQLKSLRGQIKKDAREHKRQVGLIGRVLRGRGSPERYEHIASKSFAGVEWDIKRATRQNGTGYWILVEKGGKGRSDYPGYFDGHVVYDRPEALPQVVKTWTKSILSKHSARNRLVGHSPRHMGPADKRAELKDAILHARALIQRAERSGEPVDFQAADVAFGNAAFLAHNLGMEHQKGGTFDAPGLLHSLGTRLNKLATKAKTRSGAIISERYQTRKNAWSKRDTLLGSGRPPAAMNVIDQHGGFTIETVGPKSGRNTVWRPATHPLEDKARYASLASFDPKSFFQTNNDVTKAVYKIKGYRYPVIVWFDNKTGHRIA